MAAKSKSPDFIRIFQGKVTHHVYLKDGVLCDAAGEPLGWPNWIIPTHLTPCNGTPPPVGHVRQSDGKFAAPAAKAKKRKFARLFEDKIAEIIVEHDDITQEIHPDVLSRWYELTRGREKLVEITGMSPEPDIGWVLDGDKFKAPK